MRKLLSIILELPNDPEESPTENSDSPPSGNQQEEEDEPSILDAPIELERHNEELLKVPPSKRRPAWARET